MSTQAEDRTLPQAMQQHTYAIMYRVEGSHWWFAGRRAILEEFAQDAVIKAGVKSSGFSRQPDKAGTPSGGTPNGEIPNAIRILDVGCGTGANLEMLGQFGTSEGVDVSEEALDFCRQRGLTGVEQGAAESLPYADGTFDLVTGLDV